MYITDTVYAVSFSFISSWYLVGKCSAMLLTTVDGWRTLSPMERVRSAWLKITVVVCQAR